MSPWTYILIMVLATNLVRILPITLINREITNRFIRSFLYYVPYVTLAVMTFPAILSETGSVYSALAAFVVAVMMAWSGRSLFQVALSACATVFIVECFLPVL